MFASSYEFETLLRSFGVAPIQKEDSPTDVNEFILKYVGVMDSIAQANPGKYWWSTFLGTKNRISSPLARILQAFVQFLNLKKKTDSCGFFFLIKAPHALFPIIEAFSRKNKQEPVYIGSTRNLVLFHCWKFWLKIAKEAISIMIKIRNVRRLGYGRNLIDRKKKIILITSFAYSKSIQNDVYSDPFFGCLPEFLNGKVAENERVMVLAQSFGDYKECYLKMKTVTNLKVIPYETYLSYWDVLFALGSFLLEHFRTPIRCKDNLQFYGYDISTLIKEILKFRQYGFQFTQFLSHRIGRRLTKSHQLSLVIMTFEGNPWERMLIYGIRDHVKRVPIIGFQHAVIPLCSASIFPGNWEAEGNLLPDRVLTTGRRPANILRRYGNFSNIDLYIFGSLRYNHLYEQNPLPRKSTQKSFIILVALEGLMEVRFMVEYVLEQASKQKRVDFIIRNHPSLSFESILKNSLNMKNLPSNFSFSQETSVEEDIAQCDLVLYWGTTVALEAIMLGKPVVHFDRGDLVSFDPLYELDVFKWTISPIQGLSSIIEKIQSLSEDEFVLSQKIGRKYIMEYFHPINKEAMSLFLPRKTASVSS